MKNPIPISSSEYAFTAFGFWIAFLQFSFAHPGDIITFAGTGDLGYSGDGGPATSAETGTPRDSAVDSAGNLYFIDGTRVRRVDAVSGIITTFAGGSSGGPAIVPPFQTLNGITLDAAGDVYVSDSGNHRVRRIDASSREVSTVAGTGHSGYSGDNGPAKYARLGVPAGLVFDNAGTLFIADSLEHVVRRVDGRTGIITTVAGNGGPGWTGDNVLATDTRLYHPRGLALDSAGNLFIADALNNRVRRVDAETKMITTVVGTGLPGFDEDGVLATTTRLNFAADVTVDPTGNLFVSDLVNQRIRRVDAVSGIISTVAGTGTAGFSGDGGAAVLARLDSPTYITLNPSGDLYISDSENILVRRVEKAGTPVTFQPDGRIGRKLSQQKGDGRYNLSGAGQSQNLKGSGNRPVRFFCSVQNDTDGMFADGFILRATRKNRDFTPKYILLGGGGNVTAEITRGRFAIDQIAPGKVVRLKAIVKPKTSGGSARRTFSVTSKSKWAPGKQDTVKARVQAGK